MGWAVTMSTAHVPSSIEAARQQSPLFSRGEAKAKQRDREHEARTIECQDGHIAIGRGACQDGPDFLRGPSKGVDRCGVHGMLLDLLPRSGRLLLVATAAYRGGSGRLLVLPDQHLAIIRRTGQNGAELGVGPRDLPHRPFVTNQHFPGPRGDTIHYIENLDASVRAARRQTPAVEVKLRIVLSPSQESVHRERAPSFLRSRRQSGHRTYNHALMLRFDCFGLRRGRSDRLGCKRLHKMPRQRSVSMSMPGVSRPQTADKQSAAQRSKRVRRSIERTILEEARRRRWGQPRGARQAMAMDVAPTRPATLQRRAPQACGARELR